MSSVSKTLRSIANEASSRQCSKFLPPRKKIFGRNDEIHMVGDMLKKEQTCHRILLYGSAGVGKSACALEIGHILSGFDKYQVIIWINCQSMMISNGTIVSSINAVKNVDDIIREIALLLNAESILRLPETSQRQLIGVQFIDKRCLLIVDSIDDLSDPSCNQFFDSLPDTVDILATSRQQNMFECRFEIKPFLIHDESYRKFLSSELRKKKIRMNQYDQERCLEMSEGLPQTLIWIIELYEQGIEMKEIEKQVIDPDSIISEFFFSRQWAYLDANADARRVAIIFALAQPIHHICIQQYLKIAECSLPQNQIIYKLGKMNIIKSTKQEIIVPSTFQKLLLSKCMRNMGEIARLISRWAESTLAKLEASNSNKTWQEVFDDIDTFRQEVIAICSWLSWVNNAESKNLTKKILSHICYYLYAKGFWTDLLNITNQLVYSFLNDFELRLFFEANLTWAVRVYRYRYGTEAAITYMEEELRKLTHYTNLPKIAYSYVRIARFGRHDFPWSSELVDIMFKDANEFYRYGDYKWCCRALLQIGNGYSKAKECNSARNSFNDVVHIATQSKNHPWAEEMIALSYGNIGISFNREKNWKEAKRYLSISINGLGQKYDQAVAYSELAFTCYSLKKRKEMRDCLSKVTKLKQELGLDGSVIESNEGWETQKIVELEYKVTGLRRLFRSGSLKTKA